MIRPSDRNRAAQIAVSLRGFSANIRRMPGIEPIGALDVLVAQIIESLRRIEFAYFIRDQPVDPRRLNPNDSLFDPLRAAVHWMRNGDMDEAFWLVFLFVHFGKHAEDGYRLMRDVYGELGNGVWTWRRLTQNPLAFTDWLAANEQIFASDGVSRRFGNHRKYETLRTDSPKGTAAVVQSYVEWVAPPRSHQELVRAAHLQVGQNPRDVFSFLYKSMDSVQRFGRLGKFDYLTMLGKLGIAPIDPDSTYMKEATGPLKGARLLFGGDIDANLKARDLEVWVAELDGELNVGFQVLEDSLCNWQKSPTAFISFRG